MSVGVSPRVESETDMNRIIGWMIAMLCLVLPVTAQGQDVGFANAWPESSSSHFW